MVFSKIKNLLSNDEVIVKLQETIKKSVEEVELLTKTIQEQQVEQQKLLELIKELTKDNISISKKFQKEHEEIQIANKKLSRVVGELIVFKPKLEKELAKKFKDSLQEQLDKTTNELSVDVKEHKKAQYLIIKSNEQQEILLKEITKLQEITKGISAKDFELSKHSKELHLKDQEKLRLMKRVDDLEKLLARIKTRRN